jgi:hypothetical protein
VRSSLDRTTSVRIFAQSQIASDSDDSHEEQNKRPKKSQVVKKSFDLCKSGGSQK